MSVRDYLPSERTLARVLIGLSITVATAGWMYRDKILDYINRKEAEIILEHTVNTTRDIVNVANSGN